ncbi:muscarinic Acetylcholine Receptor A-type [Carabus blaptoides fortunei]
MMHDNLTVMNESAVAASTAGPVHEPNYSITQMVFIGTVAAILSVMTVVGNIMVMISFKIDKQLQTISNYFLFSLAVADFAIGLISMPLFTVSTLLGYWPLGPHICDTWLALDYLASNASVLNLLIISFDRYFSVTRPLTYRVKRTTNKAAIMIACAWGISLLLWPPWIYSWPYIEGERTVPDDECYIQFIETNHYITFGTAIAAFYVPVTVMCFLYWRIWRTTKKRQKDLPNLQAGKKDSSKRSNSSDEANNTHSTQCASVVAVNVDPGDDGSTGGAWRTRPRSESSTGADTDSVYMDHHHHHGQGGTHHAHRRGAVVIGTGYVGRVRAWCVAWWHSGREDSDTEEDTPSEQNLGYATPVSVETPLQSSVSRCTSLNVIRDPSVSSDSVYTILIRLPAEPPPVGDQQPTIKMIPADGRSLVPPPQVPVSATSHLLHPQHQFDDLLPNHLINRRPSAMPDIRIPLNAKIIPKQLAGKAGAVMGAGRTPQQNVPAYPPVQMAQQEPCGNESRLLQLTVDAHWTRVYL